MYGTPLLAAHPKLEVILQALGPRLTGEPLAATDSVPAEREQLRITETGIAVLPIMGTLVHRSSYLSAASGLTSYHDIEADAQEAFTNPDVQGVLLELYSDETTGLVKLAACSILWMLCATWRSPPENLSGPWLMSPRCRQRHEALVGLRHCLCCG